MTFLENRRMLPKSVNKKLNLLLTFRKIGISDFRDVTYEYTPFIGIETGILRVSWI